MNVVLNRRSVLTIAGGALIPSRAVWSQHSKPSGSTMRDIELFYDARPFAAMQQARDAAIPK